MVRSLLVLFLVPVVLQANDPIEPDQPYSGRKSAPVTYQVDLSAVVTPPNHCKVLKVWFPVPPSDAAQEVSGSSFSTFPMKVVPKVGREKTYGNRFAFFEFHHPEGAQIIRHRFTVKTWQMEWDIDPAKVRKVEGWPAAFAPYLREEPLLPTSGAVARIAAAVVPAAKNPARDLEAIMGWVNRELVYSHKDCSLQGSAVFALKHRTGHCSDYHGLCTALARSIGYPTRIAYGINPYPKNSPSHCKLEAFLPPYGWVCFDVSETQNLIRAIRGAKTLSEEEKADLVARAQKRLASGFRDNTWFLQTRGSGYDLEPPARNKVAVVRTVHIEADGVPYPEPDPANPNQRAFSWMTVHHYQPDRAVPDPFKDWRTLKTGNPR